VIDFLSLFSVKQDEAKSLFDYAGGSPSLLMEMALAIEDGTTVGELLHNPLHMTKPFISSFAWLLHSAREFLGSREPLIQALRLGQHVAKRSERLELWLAGITRDPDSNPPEPLGTLVCDLLRERISGEDA
jgi:hypothetical protein